MITVAIVYITKIFEPAEYKFICTSRQIYVNLDICLTMHTNITYETMCINNDENNLRCVSIIILACFTLINTDNKL